MAGGTAGGGPDDGLVAGMAEAGMAAVVDVRGTKGRQEEIEV